MVAEWSGFATMSRFQHADENFFQRSHYSGTGDNLNHCHLHAVFFGLNNGFSDRK